MADTSPVAVYVAIKTRRGYVTLPAIDPHTGSQWDVLLSDEKIGWIGKQGIGAARELAFTVPTALLNIRHLYRGIRDDRREVDEDDWLCYISTPSKAYDRKSGACVPAWRGEVFLVYVTDERVVYNWYWDKCDLSSPHLPRDFDNRFTERIF